MSQARTGAWWRRAHNDLALVDLARTNGFHAQACDFASQAAQKALKGGFLELGLEPPHTHGLGQLDPLPLPAFSRMTMSSRTPLDDTPPSDLFDPSDSRQALSTATAVLAWVKQLDPLPR